MAVLMPVTVDEATAALAVDPTRIVLAGGTDLMVQLNSRRGAASGPDEVVALDRIGALSSWSVDARRASLTVGAMMTWAQLSSEPFRSWTPALAQAARTIGSVQVRNAATIGGNLVTASPAGDGITVLSALGAAVNTAAIDGRRILTVERLIRGVKTTALAPGEIVTSIEIPLGRGFQGFKKIGIRDAMVIALANACLVVDEGRRRIGLAVGSVGPTVLRCPRAEAIVEANVDWGAGRCDRAAVRDAVDAVRTEVRPIDDHRSSADYRRHAVGILVERLLLEAFDRTANDG